MHRREILEELCVYQRRWEGESDTVQRFIDFVSSNVECFERRLKTGHVTGSAWVVNREGTHVLLTHHRKLNRWLQLGGHSDGDSDVARVAFREAREESGLSNIEILSEDIFDIDIHRIPERGEEPEHHHFDIRFSMQAVDSDLYIVSSESHALRWIYLEELHQFTNDESLLRMARKWKADRDRDVHAAIGSGP